MDNNNTYIKNKNHKTYSLFNTYLKLGRVPTGYDNEHQILVFLITMYQCYFLEKNVLLLVI